MKKVQRLSAGDKQDKVFQVFEKIAGGYDSANVRISLGMQTMWKKMLIDEITAEANALTDSMHREYAGAQPACGRSGSIGNRGKTPGAVRGHFIPGKLRRVRILDLCTGTGDIAIGAAKALPDASVTGMDFSPSMLRVAVHKARKSGLGQIRWRRGNAMKLPYRDGYWDIVSISFGLRNCADTEQVLREIFRVLRPGGKVFCLDSFVPDSALVRPFYRLYFGGIMPRIGGGKANRKEYEWLQESTEAFVRAGELSDRMRAVGFRDVKMRRRMMGACVLHEGTKYARGRH